MAKSAVTELEAHIETIRREAYNEGYAAAMRAVTEFTTGKAGPSRAKTRQAPRAASAAKPEVRQSRRTRQVKEGARRKTGRGENARRVAQALSSLPKRTGPAATIRKQLAEQGIDVAFTSIRHGLLQLQARGEASVAADGKTWTYTGRTSQEPAP